MATTAAPIVRAPRGTELHCKGWQQEAALRCLMNNLDPENAERPADLVVYGGIGKAARNWECYHAIVRELERLERRRNAAGAVGQAGRGVSYARNGPARAHRQLQPGGQVGHMGALQRARSQRPDDVWPDDRGQLDLHRHAGHSAGHFPDFRRARGAALRRGGRAWVAEGQTSGHGWNGRHGRRAAAFRHAERRRGAGSRS